MQRSVAFVLLVVALLSGSVDARAATVDELFEQANSAYFKGNFKEAHEGYSALVERFGVDDPVLSYDLGNTAYKLERVGEAIYHYKRALALDPPPALEADIRANLRLARATLTERYRKDPGAAQFVFDESHGAAYSIFTVLGTRLAQWLFVGLWGALFVLLAARRLVRPQGVRRALGATAAVLAVLVLASFVMWTGNLWTTGQTRLGVVIAQDAVLKEGRHRDAASRPLPEGLEVRIVDTSDGDWIRIELSNGVEGWVPPTSVREIGS